MPLILGATDPEPLLADPPNRRRRATTFAPSRLEPPLGGARHAAGAPRRPHRAPGRDLPAPVADGAFRPVPAVAAVLLHRARARDLLGGDAAHDHGDHALLPLGLDDRV